MLAVQKVVLLFVLLACLGAIACSSSNDSEPSSLTIGVLVPLSGALASYGETSNAALVEALSAINASGSKKLTLAVEDTRTDPTVALDKLKTMHERGIRVVIGPYSSTEVKAVKDYADKNGVLILSPLSTATSLAIPGDSVFRFTPDDTEEANAVAALAYADGIRTILPVTRDDEGNRGLQTAMKTAFEKAGGTFLAGVTYGANETDFTTEIETLTSLLGSSTAAPGVVGVYLTGFSEVSRLLSAASMSPPLQGVKWYGSDSVAQSKEVVEDRTAAAFAVAVGYPNPILGVSDSDRVKWQPVSDRVKQKLGRAPDAFAFASYDALMVGYSALTKDGDKKDAGALKQALTTAAADYHGLTGPANLNAAGDRATSNYDFWSVCSRNGQFTWVRTVAYTSAPGKPGQIARPEAC